MGMVILITGGVGFLGYHLAKKFSGKFEKIIIFDLAAADPKEYSSNVQFVQGDVRNKALLEQVLTGVDLVVHGAAALPLWPRKDIFEINVRGTRNVLEAALKNGVQRVVFVSSTAVYGVPDKHPLYENDKLEGVGPYGESKILAEKVCEEFRKKGMIVPIVRPKTFIGTGRLGVFQILYDWVESGKKIPLIGHGQNRYQLLEVEDLAEAIYLALTAPEEKANDTFNVGAESFGTVLEDVGALCDYAGRGGGVRPFPAWLVKPALALFEKLKLSPLYKWVYGTADKDSFVSIDRAKEKLGWQPKYSNAQALIRSYQWYLDHKSECQKSGITHRVAWKQGILGWIKKCM